MVLQIIENSRKHSTRAYYAFFVMYKLGLRVSELNPNLWLKIEPNKYILQSTKGSGIRLFNISDIPSFFIEYLVNPSSRLLMTSRSGLYSVLMKSISSPLPTFAEKNTALHIFRYAYIQNLVNIGSTLEQIKETLAHKDVKNTQMYLSNLQNIVL